MLILPRKRPHSIARIVLLLLIVCLLLGGGYLLLLVSAPAIAPLAIKSIDTKTLPTPKVGEPHHHSKNRCQYTLRNRRTQLAQPRSLVALSRERQPDRWR